MCGRLKKELLWDLCKGYGGKQKYELELSNISYDRGMIIKSLIIVSQPVGLGLQRKPHRCSCVLKNVQSKFGNYDKTLPREYPLQVLQEDCNFKGLKSSGIPDSSHE